MNDTSQQIRRAQEMLFRTAERDELLKTLGDYGAVEKMPGWLWVYPPGSAVVLEITVQTDIPAYAVDLALYAYQAWRRMIDQQVGWEPSAMVTVGFADTAEARKAARAFVLAVLAQHDSVAIDDDRDHAWTLAEINQAEIIDGVGFLHSRASPGTQRVL